LETTEIEELKFYDYDEKYRPLFGLQVFIVGRNGLKYSLQKLLFKFKRTSLVFKESWNGKLELILYGIRRKNIYLLFILPLVVLLFLFNLYWKKQREFGDLDAIKS
jgi:hypothetical protein